MKISELAKQLKPYIIKWINDAGGGGGATSGGGAGGNFAPTPHALNSYHHGGQLPHNSTWMSNLASDTHTQYAAADGLGTRSAYQAERLNKSIFSGSGITGGGALTSNQTLTLRTPGVNLAASSTNAVNASGHTHAINASFDVSATATSELLKSTASGGLTLKTLDVMGAVDILGGDLTVGSAMTLFVDESGNNVGIAGAPDPQFALDVNGPFHADAIYGPLGRLLKDCVFLAHFDGPLSANDHTGTPQTVQGLLPTTSSAIVYRSAKYNKGFVSSIATTNLIPNPVFMHATWSTNWNTNPDLSSSANYDKNFIYSGSRSVKITKTGSGVSSHFYDGLALGNTNQHVLSAYVKRYDSGSIGSTDLSLFYGTALTGSYSDIGDGWYLLAASLTAQASAVAVGFLVEASNISYYVGGVQLEQKSHPTPLAHGDMVVGHSWVGTQNNSNTTRTATRLIYDIPAPETWSIGFWYQPWVSVSDVPTTTWLMSWGADSANYFAIYHSVTGSFIGRVQDNGTNTNVSLGTGVNRGQKHHFAATYNGSTMLFYIDGVYSASISASQNDTSPSTLGIGNFFSGIEPAIGIFDDFYVVKGVQTPDDIGAIVDSDVPVAAEVGATSWYSGGIAPIWVDSDGLWMRDHTGLEVMGWSAVDNKSWGGVTLDMGDNLIGRYGSGSGGWMRWDRSAGNLKLGYSNACSLAFDGSGACIVGKLQMPGASAAIAIGSTPPTASNAGTGIWIDRNGLTSVQSNVPQIKINSENGWFYAGQNAIKINASGMYINSGSTINYEQDKALNFYNGTLAGSPVVAKMYTNYLLSTGYFTVDTGEFDNSIITIRATGASDIASYKAIILEAKTGTGTTNARFSLFGNGSASLMGNLIADSDIIYEGDLVARRSSGDYTGYAFIPLATRLSSTSWDGDARSSSPKTLLDLSAVFGAPAGIKAVLVQLAIRDSNSAATDTQVILSPNNSTTQDQAISCHGLANDTWSRGQLIVPCNANGDIYYEFDASGTLTLDVHMYITGYWI